MSLSQSGAQGAASVVGGQGGDGYSGYAGQSVMSPFVPTQLFSSGESAEAWTPAPSSSLMTPFSESMASYSEADHEAEVFEALLAEFEDDEFGEALEALADEAAGRHLRSVGTWSPQSEAPVLATAEVESWIESVAAESDRVLGELEAYFGERPVDSLRDGEMEAVSGLGEWESLGMTSPIDAQEQFVKKLLRKAKKIAKAVAKVAKFHPLAQLFGILRKLIRPLLRQVLSKAIGRLPASLRPAATQLAKRFAGESNEPTGEEGGHDGSMAEVFDGQVAELVLAPNEVVAEQFLAEVDQAAGDTSSQPLHDLDVARARLARELADAVPGQPPTAQMEQFIPAVMAAMPMIRMGIRVVGRERVVNVIAGGLAQLIKGVVGAEAAKQLSRHIAKTGLDLLKLEAESGAAAGPGTEALVAVAEDTVRNVLSLPAESFEDELLLETEIQEAFAEAAARHLPAAVLRPEVVERESAGEGIWVMMPRATRPCFRYKKYSRVLPVRITRPIARAVVMSGGETLERRLLDAGVRSWPVNGEMEIYELLTGSLVGHMAAFEAGAGEEVSEATREFEELSQTAAAVLAGNPAIAATGRSGSAASSPRTGARYFRLRVGGRALVRRNALALRLDLASPRPVLNVHLRIGERDAHALAGHLEGRRMVQVVSTLRRLLDPAMRQAMAQRLERMLMKRGLTPAPGAARRLAARLGDAMVGAVSRQLPGAAPTLAQAAKDPAPGVTLSFGFTFPDKAAIATASPAQPTLTIRPGTAHD